MTVSALALAQCASEPIRVPGAIQPHGWMACFDASSGALIAYSDNWATLLPQAEPATLPGCITEALATLSLAQALADQDRPVSLGTLALGEQRLHASAHARSGLHTVELEPAGPDFGTQAPIYALALRLVPAMQQVDTVEALCQLAANKIKKLTGFGRSLVYRFDAEGHGAVLAEALDPGYDSYAQHHFPASDIPPQARELYQLNHFRLIPDARYQPVPLCVLPAGQAHTPIDLSLAGLRSVSPVHLEYMRNMGTLASLSVSIMVRGKLWGLISCHDHAPRQLSYPVRLACEHIGQLLSLQIEAKEDTAEVRERGLLSQLTLSMVAQLADSDATLQRLVQEPDTLLRMARAEGAAVLLDGHCWTVGETPAAEAIRHLGDWLASHLRDVFHTDQLPADLPGWQAHATCASGVLAISISQVHRHFVIWFRPERVQTIQWAGDPRKNAVPAGKGDGRLHPRRSFATWREQVRGRSLAWSASEVGAALELRQALIAIVLRRAEEMAEVAGELGRANKELEAFSYTVSHDLRAPMRHIAGYVDLVLDTEGERLGDASRRYLGHVKAASSFAGQLVDALLDFSRMGRSALKPVEVDLKLMLDHLVHEAGVLHPERQIHWHIDPALPRLWGDAILLQLAVRNLLDNAIKYTRHRAEATIRIDALQGPGGDGLAITDNGVGFQMKYAGKLFGVFQRLHRAEEYEGTGIGLASVRRIVERHGGTATAHGTPGEGATFSFVIPRRPAASEVALPATPAAPSTPSEPRPF